MLAVISHAYFLFNEVWRQVVWGDPAHGRLGVLSKSAELVLRHDACMYLCSGVPRDGTGRKFSPDSREFLAGHCTELPSFRGLGAVETRAKRDLLMGRIVGFDTRAQNTREEVIGASGCLAALSIQRICSVAAPKHAMRVLQELLMARDRGDLGRSEIWVTASDVDLPHATAADVCCLEHGHRYDAPPEFDRLDEMGKAILSLTKKGPEVFQNFTEDFCALVQQYGVNGPQ